MRRRENERRERERERPFMPNTECSSVSQSSAAFARQPRRQQGLEGEVKENMRITGTKMILSNETSFLPLLFQNPSSSSSPPLILLPSFLLFEAPEPFGNAI